SGSGAVPATLAINGTVGGTLIEAVVRAHGSSQLKAHPSKAMPMGPVKAHTARNIRISARRHGIGVIIAPPRRRRSRADDFGGPNGIRALVGHLDFSIFGFAIRL